MQNPELNISQVHNLAPDVSQVQSPELDFNQAENQISFIMDVIQVQVLIDNVVSQAYVQAQVNAMNARVNSLSKGTTPTPTKFLSQLLGHYQAVTIIWNKIRGAARALLVSHNTV